MLRIKQAEAKYGGERASKAVGKKMRGLAGVTAEVAAELRFPRQVGMGVLQEVRREGRLD